MNFKPLLKTIETADDDFYRVGNDKYAQCQVLISMCSQLDKGLKKMIKDMNGDSAVFEDCVSAGMQLALKDVAPSVSVIDDHWRLICEGNLEEV